MILTHVGLGVKYGGVCPVCKSQTGSRSFELAATSLYRGADGKFHVVHPICAGGATKSRVSGGVAYRTQPSHTLEVEL